MELCGAEFFYHRGMLTQRLHGDLIAGDAIHGIP